MPLANGASIGPYQIVGWLGAGGMGDVYRARDSRLDRDVALKFISEAFAADAGRVRRFAQEARAAGQLSHPNILAVFDVGTHAGRPYIVSELLEGGSLRARLEGGAIAWRKAVDWARQTAEGLAAAHERELVHRDVKPDNLFVTNDGRIKILDFGIAKLTRPSDEGDAPIGSATDTADGTVVGTTGYMSPEQVRGESVDGRSDIFSLGTILHEMLSGRAAFARGTAAETMAAILKDDPQEPLPPTIPPALDRVVSHCLEKAREARFQSARDLAFALEGVSGTTSATPAVDLTRSSWPAGRALPWMAAVLVAGALGFGLARWAPWRTPPAQSVLHLATALGTDNSLANTLMNQYGNATVLSPDGTLVVFIAQKGETGRPLLYVRRLDQLDAEPLLGTEDPIAPFFSPDGQWIGFASGAKLKKVAVTGGAAVPLADVKDLRGGTWADDGTIIFAPERSRLLRMSEDGGTPEPLAPLAEGEVTQQWPQMLPGSKRVLYTSTTAPGSVNDANLVVQSLTDGARKVVQRGGFYGRYLRSGHLVYIHDATLFAAPFDLDRLAITGPALPVQKGVASNAVTGGAQFSVSDTGLLLYQPGSMYGGGSLLQLLTKDGLLAPIASRPANWSNPQFAPGGGRIALHIQDGTSGIWIQDLLSGALTRMPSNGARNYKPVWSPDGRFIVFGSDRDSQSATNLYVQRADGTGDIERLTESPSQQLPGSWHPSGRFLAFEENVKLMILPMEGSDTVGWKPGRPYPFTSSPFVEHEPMFSPDGRWVAHMSNESGRVEVYVRSFPDPGGKWQISTAGGQTPTWSRTGDELFYGSHGQIMVVRYTTDGRTFHAQKPQLWAEQHYMTRGQNRMFDLHPDGARFALAPAAQAPPGAPLDKVVFVLNFFDELRRVAPDF